MKTPMIIETAGEAPIQGRGSRPPRIKPKTAIIAVLALAAASMIFAANKKTDPDKPASGIIMNHAFKVNSMQTECSVCHSPVQSNSRLIGFPTMDTCAACHSPATDKSQGTEACVGCHSNTDYSSQVRKDQVLMPEVFFDHAKHGAAGVDCLACHAMFDKIGVTGDEMLPKMATCMTCHAKKRVPAGTDCDTCHTNAGIGSERPASHTPLWTTIHGRGLSKKTIDQSCDLCHTAAAGNDCASCHQREAPPNHSLAWDLGSHGIAAKNKRSNCEVCHTEDQCIACHTSQEPATHTASWSAPLDKHCYSCHFQDFPAGGYGSSKLGSNCGVCHTGAQVLAQHEADHQPADHAIGHTNCSICHFGTGAGKTRILHPYPTLAGVGNNAQCVLCHLP